MTAAQCKAARRRAKRMQPRARIPLAKALKRAEEAGKPKKRKKR